MKYMIIFVASIYLSIQVPVMKATIKDWPVLETIKTHYKKIDTVIDCAQDSSLPKCKTQK